MIAKKKSDNEDFIKCSFCGKTQVEVEKIIAGPGVYICNECVMLCNDILKEETYDFTNSEEEQLPNPIEIKQELDKYVIGQDFAKKVLSVLFIITIKELDYFNQTKTMVLKFKKAIFYY